MKRLIVFVILVTSIVPACATGQSAPSDSGSRHNYGPYEIRGAVTPPTRNIPFHQHLWKAIEYPAEAAVRVASLPFIGAAHLTGVDYGSGHLMQLFYFDRARGYIFPSAETETDRSSSMAIRLFHSSPVPLLRGCSVGGRYGGALDHSIDAGISISRLSVGGWTLTRSDHYIYDEDRRARFTLRDRVGYARLSFDIRSDLEAGLVGSYRYDEAAQRGNECSAGLPADLYASCFGNGDSEERWAAGVELTYDTRAKGDQSPDGWLFDGAATRVFGSRSGDGDYWRYCAEIRRHLNVYSGTRILSLRARANGARRINGEPIPFWELPTLGGDDLRGFSADRFRDNIAAVLSVEYSYPIFQGLRGMLFTDFGAVAVAWRAFELDRFQTGYGLELQSQLDRNFLFRFRFAHSRDGFHFYLGASTTVDLGLAEGLL